MATYPFKEVCPSLQSLLALCMQGPIIEPIAWIMNPPKNFLEIITVVLNAAMPRGFDCFVIDCKLAALGQIHSFNIFTASQHCILKKECHQ